LKLDIYFANSVETIEVDEENIQEIIYPNKVEKKDQKALLLKAFKNPINSVSFYDFIDANDRFIIIVNDIFRSTPTSKILDFIVDDIKDKDFRILIATGSHRKPTEDEKKKIVGESFYNRFKNLILFHDSKLSNHVYLGKSKFGTDIYINNIIFDYGALITINSIEPHYFAGYTGGRKSIVPGIAGYETITQNHHFALKKEAQLTKLKGNPVHEDIEDIVSKVNSKVKIFSINIVTDFDGNIYDCATGNIFDSFYSLIPSANEVYSAKISGKADIVLTVTRPPLDSNLYQSQKALESAKVAVKDNGIIILKTS